jgi:hypothetical protein
MGLEAREGRGEDQRAGSGRNASFEKGDTHDIGVAEVTVVFGRVKWPEGIPKGRRKRVGRKMREAKISSGSRAHVDRRERLSRHARTLNATR